MPGYPFTFVMAHLKAQETRHNPQQRGVWKFTLVRRLYELGYERLDGITLALELKYGADHPLLPRVLDTLREQTNVERGTWID